MRKKGFTLVELLAVISILAIIGLIGTTAVTKIVKDNKQKAYDIQVSSIVDSAKMWGMDNVGMLPDEDESSLITLSMLELGHYVDKDITNPLTGELLSKDTSVCVMNNAGSYNYSYSPNGTCTGNMNNKYFTNDRCFAFDTTTGTVTGYYNYEDNSEANAACPLDIIMPSKIKGVQVNKIGDNSFKGTWISSIYIASTVTEIGEKAFEASRLKRVILPSNLQTIGTEAFGWAQLTSIVIPPSVTKIGYRAFDSNKLTDVKILGEDVEISTQSFNYNQISNLELNPKITNILPQAFNSNNLPEEKAFIYKRNSDGSINNTILIGYGGLKKDNVVVPSSVTTLADGAFCNSGINSITIPNTVREIESAALAYNHLTSIVIPSSVTKLKYGVLNVNPLTSITIPNSVTSIETYALGWTKLKEVNIPNSVTSIATPAFRETTTIEKITIDNTKDAIPGAPWEAPDTATITWLR